MSTDKTQGGNSSFKPLPEEMIIRKSDIANQKEELDKIGLQAIQNGEGISLFIT